MDHMITILHIHSHWKTLPMWDKTEEMFCPDNSRTQNLQYTSQKNPGRLLSGVRELVGGQRSGVRGCGWPLRQCLAVEAQAGQIRRPLLTSTKFPGTNQRAWNTNWCRAKPQQLKLQFQNSCTSTLPSSSPNCELFGVLNRQQSFQWEQKAGSGSFKLPQKAQRK